MCGPAPGAQTKVMVEVRSFHQPRSPAGDLNGSLLAPPLAGNWNSSIQQTLLGVRELSWSSQRLPLRSQA